MTSSVALRIIVPTLWLAWLLYWWASARGVKAERWQEPLKSQLLHRVPLVLGAILLVVPQQLPRILRARVLPAGPVLPVLGAFLVAAGLGFSVSARRHLGRNWSASVVVKEDHALIRTGPYKHLRHPIYSGILLAFLGMAITIGEWRGLLSLGLVMVSLARKSWVEEQRMGEVFPEYEQYRRGTAAIVPFLW